MYKRQENGGVSSARNLGIEGAEGKYIWFVDSDDYIEPFSLEQMYYAQESQQPDIYLFNTSGFQELSVGTIDEFLQKYYFTYVAGFGPWNKLYKTSIIKNNGLLFDTEETIGEDLLFNISYYKAIYSGGKGKAFFFIGRDYYNYIDRVGSAMNTVHKDRLVQQLRLYNKIEEMLLGMIHDDNMTYLFWMHLVSGILQSAKGGLNCEMFSDRVDYSKYKDRLEGFKDIKEQFFKNENASMLGRKRIELFAYLMVKGKYKIAGKVIGLK